MKKQKITKITKLRDSWQADARLETLLSQLRTSSDGLTEREAQKRLLRFGPNKVVHDQAPSVLRQLWRAFKNPFILVLCSLALISFFTDFWWPLQHGEETSLSGIIIIMTMVLLSGLLCFWQEYQSNKAAYALRSMITNTAMVWRRQNKDSAPELRSIAVDDLVPGDVIALAAGDIVPADVRLLQSRDLFINQSLLSGESIPVEKNHADIVADEHQPPSRDVSEHAVLNPLDSGNICFMGSDVVGGRATAVVVATADRTYLGSLASAVVGLRPQTAFDRGVNSVSWLLIRFMMVMVPVVFFINGFTKGDWGDAALFALAVAVGLTPEMLPMVVSANLAKGAMTLAKRKVVVKRLDAIQNFGSMDVLCTDKTGTLTEDHIVLADYVNTRGQKDDQVLMLAWLNSYLQSNARNLMDQAIVQFVQQHPEAGVTATGYQKIDELAFDFTRRRLSVIVEYGQQAPMMVCKGAVEEMLEASSKIREADGDYPLDEARQQQILALTQRYHEEGFRVLAIAVKPDMPLQEHYSAADEQGLILCGLLTFLDPPKESARVAIEALKQQGVMVKVLTGDNALVTTKICRDVGIDVKQPLQGQDIAALSDEELAPLLQQHTVFAKLTPLQKARIVVLLQQAGHTVGFLGDGINDAPALREADVGISVDSATDIAKESADIILLEKSLQILETGVIKGRETFGNIIKYLNMTASSNFGNVFSVLFASAFLPFLPMLAIQLLVQNLLYDISQLSLPWDKMDPEFLRKPRKWDAANIGRFMLCIGPLSSIFDITTFALMWYVFHANTPEMQSLFHSGWFVEGLLSQTLVVHMLRTRKIPFIQSRASRPVLLMTALIMAVGICIPYSPVGRWIGLVPLPLSYFPYLVLTLFCYCVTVQVVKRLYIRRFGQWF